VAGPLDVSRAPHRRQRDGNGAISARIIHTSVVAPPIIRRRLTAAAIPENLIDSELFGALPVAPLDATRKIDGKSRRRERGTLLLDEVGDPVP
jgi:DNA-binding NtrC family response regulator